MPTKKTRRNSDLRMDLQRQTRTRRYGESLCGRRDHLRCVQQGLQGQLIVTIDWSTVVRLVMVDIAVDVLFDFGDRFAVSRARVRLLGIVRTLSVVVADVVRFHLLLDVFEHWIEMIETKDRRSVQKWLDFFVLRFGSDLVVGSLDFLEDFRMTLFGFHIQMLVRVMLFT